MSEASVLAGIDEARQAVAAARAELGRMAGDGGTITRVIAANLAHAAHDLDVAAAGFEEAR